MARPNGFRSDQLAEIRTGLTAADSATLTDANIPPAQAIDCLGFDSIWVGVEFVGGASPTAVFEVLFRDPDAADGSRWKRCLFQGAMPGVTTVGAVANQVTTALDGTTLYEMRVDGRRAVFVRCTTVTNAPTSFKVLATGGVRRYVQNAIE